MTSLTNWYGIEPPAVSAFDGRGAGGARREAAPRRAWARSPRPASLPPQRPPAGVREASGPPSRPMGASMRHRPPRARTAAMMRRSFGRSAR
ncbi:hypothetical protein [Lysobacter gummosus]|uniref:hypothetical protein n=1 Tax=Lysobacter gummosus TaxID=262324 RepID=UPI00362BF396